MRRAVFAVFALVLMSAARAECQTVTDTTGAIVGRVTDQTAAALPGVTVVISSPGLIGTATRTTDAEGAYRFAALPPAEYTLVFTRQSFKTLRRTGVPVALGFTATVDEVMFLGVGESVTVVSATPVLDRKSASVTVGFDAPQLANVPGARSMGAVLSATPAVQFARFDVGGSSGLISPQFSAYGTNGQAYPMLEGISIAFINPFGLTLDYGSFQEVSVTSAAAGAEMLTMGLRVQFVTKSGGNQYHGSLYADYGDAGWQAFNIDQAQVERAAAAGASLSRDDNRLRGYYDLNADLGGYIKKDRLWWYASSRRQAVSARFVTFPVKPYRTEVWNFSVKGTYRVNARHRLVVFANATHDHEPNLHEAFNSSGSVLAATPAMSPFEDATSRKLAFGSIAKAEWNWAIGPSLFAEVRIGRFAPRREEIPNGDAPRFENVTTSVVTGGNRDWEARMSKPQLLMSTTYFRDGWVGSHQLKLGAESARLTESQSWRHAYPGNVLHIVGDEAGETRPREVFLFKTPSRSESGLWMYSGYVSDAWQMHARLSLNLGLRFDRLRAFLPEQFHPSGPVTAITQIFAANDNLSASNVTSPRVGLVYDATGDGKTLLKTSYGLYPFIPGTELGFNANPNSNTPWDRYVWVDDNGDGAWQPGEQKATLATRGLEKIDPALKLPYTREFVLSVERELPGGVALRSGLVWRGFRRPYARQDANRPWSAYNVATLIHDRGPDGVLGNADDGPDITAYLPPSGPSNNLVRNVPDARTDHWTWDITAVKRSRGRWSLVAGFAHTWSRDHANAYAGQQIRQNPYPLTPNDLINTGDGGRHEFTIWSARIHGHYDAPWGLRVTPFLRHQAGQPLGRTLDGAIPGLNRILAEPIGTRRMDHLTSLDLRVEKGFQLPGQGRVAAFVDVFNLCNANPEQNVSWVSGTSFLRPLTIVPPRLVRIGVKFDW